ncbi:uncharacterized protein LOC114475939 isoform X2 [Gouania willdenowi]|uniref:uncharacterized protein LOC114475939 isoform X2 n=1 Tax=Gouania willdenowi TaxID=441366 RepID=UPI0010556BEC|nr:uncharacterized protein LOC114475939 isoform X2 [Gouania willdenowi]
MTVTKATIEPRHNEHQVKLPQDTHVTMRPQMGSASKTNKINQHSYTYPRRLKSMEENSIQINLPTDMCLSAQAVPVKNLSPPFYLCTRNTFSINTNRDRFNSPESSKNIGNATSAKHKNVSPNSPKNTMTSAFALNQNKSRCMPFMHDNLVIGHEKPKIRASPASNKSYINAVVSSNTLNHEDVLGQDSVLLNSFKPKVFVSTPSLLTSSNRFKATSLKTKVSHHVALRDASQVKQPASLESSRLSKKQENYSVSNETLYQSAQTHQVPQVANNRAQTGDEFGFVPHQENRFCNSLLHISETQTLRKEHNKICVRNHSKSASNSDEEMPSKKDKLNDNLINELVAHESKDHKNSSLSQATNLENYISIIKSNSSCLQGCINSQQQKLERNYEYMKEDCRQQFESCPLVSVIKSNAESDMSVWHSNIELEPNKKSSLLVKEQTKSQPVISNEEKSFNNPIHQTSGFITSHLPQAHTIPHHSFPVSNLFSTKRPHCAQGGPQSNSLISSSTTHSASHHHLQSSEAEAVIKADLHPSPAPPQLCPEETCLAHSHPSDAGLLLPPSPQCSKSAALQRRLETVEASLAANKERITTLLNIIHDLEICRSPSSRQQSFKTGKDLKNCSACQETACIVYSVEYDFRQQERRFLEILNCTAGGSHFFPTHHSRQSNCTLLRNVVMKHLTKTKVKSKKLCKTVFRWLPRKNMRV